MIKTGVIGLGNMGQHHAKAYARLNDVDFVAACDSNRDRFNAIEKSKHTQFFESVEDMLNSVSLDAVSICVPTLHHYYVAKHCLNLGIAVLVEKPLAATIDEAQRLVDCAKTNNALLTVGHIERFNPAVLKVKELIQSGNLGDIQAIHCHRYGPFPKQIKDANVLVDVAVHDIDIIQFLVDSTVVKAEVFSKNIHCKDRSDYGHIMLHFSSEVLATVVVSWAFPYKKRTVEIVGDNGIALVDCLLQTVTVYPARVTQTKNELFLPLSEPQSILIQKKEPIIEQCRQFCNAVNLGVSPMVRPEQALEALTLALTPPACIEYHNIMR
jgi:UDP-N-acetylglucosamine 3-dehydrogenase